MRSDELREDGSPEGTAEAIDTIPEREARAKPDSGMPMKPQMAPKEPDTPTPGQYGGWAGASIWQVARTVAVALLTAAVVLGSLFLIWQVKTFVGWFVIALFLAAVLNPAVSNLINKTIDTCHGRHPVEGYLCR